MAYTTRDFKTKKALREALAAGAIVTVFQPGGIFPLDTTGSRVFLEGPHYPAPHTWYAQGTVDAGSEYGVRLLVIK